MAYLQQETSLIQQWNPYRECGILSRISGTLMEAQGLAACLGELCHIPSFRSSPVLAEVIDLHHQTTVLLALTPVHDLALGTEVIPLRRPASLPLSNHLLGRVIDGFGNPLDGNPPLPKAPLSPLFASPPAPMSRTPIQEIFPTGIRAIDALLTVGEGQRVGIFSEPGGGKSSLLSTIAKGAQNTINVIALIGERGKEVRDYVHQHKESLAAQRTIIIASTAYDTAASKVIAGRAAITIAEYFRDQGARVLFIMDSLSRWIESLQEVALARGETLSTHHYAASVFHHVAAFLERAGNNDKGSITSFYAMLHYANHPDIFNDYVKSLLDGHFFLSPQEKSFSSPPINLLTSLSRSARQLVHPHHYAAAQELLSLLKAYHEAIDIIQLGAYVPGQDAKLDRAIRILPSLQEFLSQPLSNYSAIHDTIEQLCRLLNHE